MDRFVYDATDEAATASLGAALERVLPDGSVVALCGTLGAGKTRLVQAIAEAAGVDRRSVVSPTFVLVQEYQGRRAIYHLDAYRLRDEDEFLQLGPEEYFERSGLTLVEWADRVEGCLPAERVEIHVEVTGPESRRFTIIPRGPRFADLMACLRTRLEGNAA
jgi:tRNA threonylcarbamoyladenosine biosynthesis protein TsaE